MKAAILWALGLLNCLASGAMAEPFKVLSGEHENFTRLVTPLSGVSDWRVTQAGTDVTITFENHADGFDVSGVFDLIPRDRVDRLTTQPSSLILTLSCDCHVATFVAAGPYLVIDIAALDVRLAGDLVVPQSQKVVTGSPEMPAQLDVPDSAKPKRNVAKLLAPPGTGPVVEGLPTEPPPAAILPLLPGPNRSARAAISFPQHALDRAQLPEQERQILIDMQEQLARQLGSAATQGVLTPAPGRALPQAPEVNQVRDFKADPPPMPTEQMLGPRANIRISTSMDRPDQLQSGLVDAVGLSCPPPGSFDLAEWGTDEAFADQISEARKGLYGELDRLDHAVATQLARRYLYFGFGAEARQVLELDAALVQKNGALLLIAEILDETTPSDLRSLSRNPDCEPDIVLWATLAQPEPVQGAQPDAAAALRALNELPVHLRQILAPMLSQKLLAFGDAQAAGQALRSLERQPDPLRSAAKLAQAELTLHNGDTNNATRQFEDVAGENSAQSPAALIALVDAKIADNQPIAIETADLVAAYAHELQNTELGPGLRRAHVLSLLKTGQFDAAFAASRALGGDADTIAAQELRVHLLRELTTAADDITFLHHVFAQRDDDIAALPPSDLSALAERFLTIGFAEYAAETLDHIPDSARRADQKILAGKIALALGKPYMAQASLLGVGGKAAQMLRADAKRMTGDHAAARDLYMQTDQLAPAAEAAWLAEDWQRLTSAETPVFGPATRLSAASDAQNAAVPGMLARSAAALDESAAARQTLTDLLNAEELQVPEEN